MRLFRFWTTWAALLDVALGAAGGSGGARSMPAASVETLAEAAFTKWAVGNGEPYCDVQVSEERNDGFFAGVRMRAWFRPSAAAPWEEREALVECRQVA